MAGNLYLHVRRRWLMSWRDVLWLGMLCLMLWAVEHTYVAKSSLNRVDQPTPVILKPPHPSMAETAATQNNAKALEQATFLQSELDMPWLAWFTALEIVKQKNPDWTITMLRQTLQGKGRRMILQLEGEIPAFEQILPLSEELSRIKSVQTVKLLHHALKQDASGKSVQFSLVLTIDWTRS